MLYLNLKEKEINKQLAENLTLTSVVFESSNGVGCCGFSVI